MTGAEIYRQFEINTDSQYSFYNDRVRATSLLSQAYRNVFNRLAINAGDNTNIDKMLQILYRHDEAVTPTSNVASCLSFKDTLAWPITIKAKFTQNGIVYYYEATKFMGKKNSQLEAATVDFPKYEISSTGFVVQYNTGTVSITGTAVTGTGTAFTSSMIGSYFYVGSTSYGLITAVGGGTSLTVTTASGNQTGVNYTIYSSIASDTIKIYPTTVTCQEITADYYAETPDIDSSGTVDLNMDKDLVNRIIEEAINIAAASQSDPQMYQLSSSQQQNNK